MQEFWNELDDKLDAARTLPRASVLLFINEGFRWIISYLIPQETLSPEVKTSGKWSQPLSGYFLRNWMKQRWVSQEHSLTGSDFKTIWDTCLQKIKSMFLEHENSSLDHPVIELKRWWGHAGLVCCHLHPAQRSSNSSVPTMCISWVITQGHLLGRASPLALVLLSGPTFCSFSHPPNIYLKHVTVFLHSPDGSLSTPSFFKQFSLDLWGKMVVALTNPLLPQPPWMAAFFYNFQWGSGLEGKVCSPLPSTCGLS